jgi:hypothetical protein
MARAVLPFPVLPGKTEADIRRIAERFKAEPDAYWESRHAVGISLERAYWQHTPMGDFVVAYIESVSTVPETVGAMTQDRSKMGLFFAENVLDVHGVDITQPPQGAPAEIVAEWSDPDVSKRGRGFAFCAPLVPDQVERARAWARETFASADMTRTRRELGERLEVVMLHDTPQGPMTGIYLEGDDPAASNSAFAASDDPFHVAFRATLREIYPPFIDFSQPVPGITEIFDSEALPARS